MIRAIIVENEIPNLEYLKGILLRDFPEIEIVAECPTVLESTEKINLLRPDIVFLDIELDEEDGGFKILRHTSSVNYQVIFTTSHAEHAIQAFKFCALHFLLRPFGSDDIWEALSRYKAEGAKGSGRNVEAFLYNSQQPDVSLHKVGIPVLGGFDFLTVAEIIMCRSEDNCTIFHLTNKIKITATKTLKWVESLFGNHYFFRIHDSYLINLNHIKSYRKGGEGGVVELTD